MSERNYYVICDDNCKFPAMTKEEVIAAIAEATGTTPTRIDEAFITKLQEQNKNSSLKIWVGTESEYNGIETKETDTLYMITDKSEVGDEILSLKNRVSYLEAYIETHPKIKKIVQHTATFDRAGLNTISLSDIGFTEDDNGKKFKLDINVEYNLSQSDNQEMFRGIFAEYTRGDHKSLAYYYSSSQTDGNYNFHVGTVIGTYVKPPSDNAVGLVTSATFANYETVTTELIVYED